MKNLSDISKHGHGRVKQHKCCDKVYIGYASWVKHRRSHRIKEKAIKDGSGVDK